MTRYEKSKTDLARDRIGMKEAGVKSMKRWEQSMADHREDVMNAHESYRHRREPERIPFNVSPNGPYFRDGAVNRDPHDPFGGKDQ